MSQHLMKKAIEAALNAFRRKMDSFTIYGVTMRIAHAHDNQYQVLLPGDVEFVRLIAGEKIQVLV